ncbi:MAG TPA: hypothetical protein VGC76_06165 [Pyrinomonadaceae bacterium]|jgi:putative methionine-R-sulfoxide reductase with GAF domain
MKQTTANNENEQVKFDVKKLVSLSQETALTALETSIVVQKVADKQAQETVNFVVAATEASAKAAQNYWNGVSQIQKNWLGFYAEAAEKAIKNPFVPEFPMQKELIDFGKEVLNQTQKAYENVTAQAK